MSEDKVSKNKKEKSKSKKNKSDDKKSKDKKAKAETKTIEKKEDKNKSKDSKKDIDKEIENNNKVEEEEEKNKTPSYYGEPIKKGDLIRLEKVGSTIPTATEKKSIVFEATNLEDAKKMPNFDPQKAQLYTPELVLVGEKGFILDKLADELLNMKYGEERTIILEPKDAFGERDPKKIEKIGINKYKKIMKKEPRLGAEFYDEKGRHGTVIFVDQGRVRIDFNHPLAGRKVKYKIKAIERIDGLENKIKAFIMRNIPNSIVSMFEINIDEDKNEVNIKIPEYLTMQQNLGYAEFIIAYELQNYLKLGTVNFIHSFEKREPKPPASDNATQESNTILQEEAINKNDKNDKNKEKSNKKE
ncbi:MAG: FKBP-type peptidyl-prolyl cis-trans isomerase [Candidatus Helarchaeota archaeon]